MQNLQEFWHLTGFYNATWEHLVMLVEIGRASGRERVCLYV